MQAESLCENLPELLARPRVHDEVHRRVDGQQQVREVDDVVHPLVAHAGRVAAAAQPGTKKSVQ